MNNLNLKYLNIRNIYVIYQNSKDSTITPFVVLSKFFINFKSISNLTIHEQPKRYVFLSIPVLSAANKYIFLLVPSFTIGKIGFNHFSIIDLYIHS